MRSTALLRPALGRVRSELEGAVRWRALPTRRLGDLAPRGTLSGDEVALTFDDGPDPRYTPAVLRLLERAGARATFFVCGEPARRHPALLRSVVAEGHVVAGHTWNHVRVDRMDREQWIAEVDDTHDLLEDLTDRPVRYFRPPWGRYSPVTLARLHRRRIGTALWSVSSEDTVQAEPGRIVEHVAPGLRPGAVVLLHDGCGDLLAPGSTLPPGAHADRSVTVTALAGILEELRHRGLRSVALPTEQPVQPEGGPPAEPQPATA